MTMISKPLKIHGGKAYLASWLHANAPPKGSYTHRNIACFGGGGEFWNWEHAGVSESVNDINIDLINFYKVLQDRESAAELIRVLSVTPFSEVEWKIAEGHQLLPGFAGISIECAIQFFVRYRQSRQGLGTCYATPTTRTRRGMNENVSAWLSAVEGLQECVDRLARVEIRNMDARKYIEMYDHKNAFFYIDPPYMHTTRTSVGEYAGFEMTEDDHKRILDALMLLKGKFMLSGYHSDYYDSRAELHGWRVVEMEIDNKASSSKKKDKRIECLWMNYT